MSEHSSADNSPAGSSPRQGVYLVRAGRGGERDLQVRATDSFQVSARRGGRSNHPVQGSSADNFQVSPSRGGGTDLQGRAAGSFQAGSSPWQTVYVVKAIWGVLPRKRRYHPGRQAVFHQANPSRGGEVDRQACAAGCYQVSAGQGGRSYDPGRQAVFHLASPSCGGEVDRRAGATLDNRDILLINKANTASAANAHRILTNTTGTGGGMAEAIIPNLCPWWIPSRGFLLLNPIRTAKERTGAKWS